MVGDKIMKKTFLIVSAFAALFLAACNKIEKTEQVKEITDITFTVASPDTKAVKTAWAAGDEIMIFFEGKVEVGQQAKLRYDGSFWKLVQKPNGLSYTPGIIRAGRYYSVHYPGSIIYNGQDDDRRKIMNYRAGISLANKEADSYFDVSTEGVIELGTISLKKGVRKAFQVVVPGISSGDNYTLSVTCDGIVTDAEDNSGMQSNSYVRRCYPYLKNNGAIEFGTEYDNVYGISNPDGVEFFFEINSRISGEKVAASLYKYVFSLSDGTQLYYYTIAKTSDKTIADKSAIKLPVFDGKGAQTYWKTTL